MESTPAASQSTVTSSDRFMGRVKWFNNKAGYGFITVTDGHKAGSDIFVHHSSVKVDAQQYKYLIQGEYVEFALSSVSNGNHEFQASDVSGIKGGKLMCETRHELVATRTSYKTHDKTHAQTHDKASDEKVSDEKASDDKAWTPARKPRQQAAPVEPATQDARIVKSAGRGSGTGRGQSTGRGGRGSGRGQSTGRGGRGSPA
jgi:CspA family cold shock protein